MRLSKVCIIFLYTLSKHPVLSPEDLRPWEIKRVVYALFMFHFICKK
jgi:hypothetical protein